MNKFCGKCGKALNENEPICTNCNPMPTCPPVKKNQYDVFYIVGALILVFLFDAFLFLIVYKTVDLKDIFHEIQNEMIDRENDQVTSYRNLAIQFTNQIGEADDLLGDLYDDLYELYQDQSQNFSSQKAEVVLKDYKDEIAEINSYHKEIERLFRELAILPDYNYEDLMPLKNYVQKARDEYESLYELLNWSDQSFFRFLLSYYYNLERLDSYYDRLCSLTETSNYHSDNFY